MDNLDNLIDASEVPGGVLSHVRFTPEFVANLEPSFSEDNHPGWNLLKVLKTDTGSVPWHISINGEYYVGVWSSTGRFSKYVTYFYPSDERGNYIISLSNVVFESRNFIDMAKACDKFANKLAEDSKTII